jgi:hypothetical protein
MGVSLLQDRNILFFQNGSHQLVKTKDAAEAHAYGSTTGIKEVPQYCAPCAFISSKSRSSSNKTPPQSGHV